MLLNDLAYVADHDMESTILYYYNPHDGLPLGVLDKPVQRGLQPGGVGGVVPLLGHLRHCSQKGGGAHFITSFS